MELLLPIRLRSGCGWLLRLLGAHLATPLPNNYSHNGDEDDEEAESHRQAHDQAKSCSFFVALVPSATKRSVGSKEPGLTRHAVGSDAGANHPPPLCVDVAVGAVSGLDLDHACGGAGMALAGVARDAECTSDPTKEEKGEKFSVHCPLCWILSCVRSWRRRLTNLLLYWMRLLAQPVFLRPKLATTLTNLLLYRMRLLARPVLFLAS